MRNSKILDRGSEKLVAFAEKRTTDARGNSVLEPDLENFHVRMVSVATGDQSDAKLNGQLSVKILRVSTRIIPGIGSQSLFWLRGELWDLAIPPKVSRQTRALRHQELVLRSRNETAADPTIQAGGEIAA